MSVSSKLEDLWDDIREDEAWDHLRTDGIRLVPGIGTYTPKFFVVGEAPGAQENLHGRPFCGPSGNVLLQLMKLAGLYIGGKNANTWLTNTVKYRPPGNRTPNIREILQAQPYLRREWAILGRPKIIVAVGAVAWAALGPVTLGGISQWAGQVLQLKGDSFIVPMFHPAFGLRKPDMQPKMERDWENLPARLKELDL